MTIAEIQRRLKRNSFFSFGVPFLVLLVGGSFVLKHYAQLRYTFRKKTLKMDGEGSELLKKMKPVEETPTIEHEYEKLKKMDIDNWVNVRGPRPWEDSKSMQSSQKQTGSSTS